MQRSGQWAEMQASMHMSPQTVQNLETFANTGAVPGEHLLNMADISQQTLAMHQLRQASQQASAQEVRRGASAAERLPSPRRVGSSLSRPSEDAIGSVQPALEPRQVELSSQSMLGAENWLSQPLPPHLQASSPHQVSPHQMEGSAAADIERNLLQAQSAPQMAQTMQLLQHVASQFGPFEGDFLQQTIQEIAKQCAPESTPNWGSIPNAATPAVAPVNNAWGWGSGQQGASNQRSTTKGGEDTFDIDQRIEELNTYIRQQAQEYTEGQAEWSRQIAEVRGECQRELERVKREKEKVERQARQELVRLSHRLREHGVKDEAPGTDGVHGSPESSFRQVSAWSADVTMEEYQQVQRKSADAEERVRQLEQYIKDQSAKHLLCGYAQLKEKDDEIHKLKQVIVANGLELQQANAELQALRVQYEHKVHFWDQGARRLLSVAEQFLRQRSDRGGGSEEERRDDGGHFGRTATKLSLTLSQGKEGGDVGSLRRLLKDALTQSATSEGKNGRAKKAARRAKEEGSKAEASQGEEPTVVEAKLEEAKTEEPELEESKPAEGDCSTSWTPSPGSLLAAGPTSTALSDSNASSRETSPGRDAWRVVGRSDVPLGFGVGDASQSPGVMHFLSQFANEIRQLLAMSQQPGPGASPAGSPVASAQASPRSSGPGSPTSGSASSRALSPWSPPTAGQQRSPATAGQLQDRGRVQQILDAMLPARKGIAQNIITVEKMLRSLERDLRKQCEELLGQEELQVEFLQGAGSQNGAASDEETVYAAAAEDEAKRHVPFVEDGQVLGMSSLRCAQRRSSTLLAQFVQLPQKLKEVFDLTKKLGIEVNGLLPSSTPNQSEAHASWARMLEQRHAFHVELLQKRLQTLTSKVAELQGGISDDQCNDRQLPQAAEDAAADDAEAVAQQIHEEVERGVSKEEQLVAVRTRLRRLMRELTSQGDKMRSLEDEVVNLHLSRYTERAQSLAFMQQSAGLQKPSAWPWCFAPPPTNGSSEAADQAAAAGAAAAAAPFRMSCQQAWGSSSPGLMPTATCVA